MSAIFNLQGEFTWMWNDVFFIETSQGNFIWSDPDYGGNNTIKHYPHTYGEFLQEADLPFGRSKGCHIVGHYCQCDGVMASLVEE